MGENGLSGGPPVLRGFRAEFGRTPEGIASLRRFFSGALPDEGSSPPGGSPKKRGVRSRGPPGAVRLGPWVKLSLVGPIVGLGTLPFLGSGLDLFQGSGWTSAGGPSAGCPCLPCRQVHQAIGVPVFQWHSRRKILSIRKLKGEKLKGQMRKRGENRPGPRPGPGGFPRGVVGPGWFSNQPGECPVKPASNGGRVIRVDRRPQGPRPCRGPWKGLDQFQSVAGFQVPSHAKAWVPFVPPARGGCLGRPRPASQVAGRSDLLRGRFPEGGFACPRS